MNRHGERSGCGTSFGASLAQAVVVLLLGAIVLALCALLSTSCVSVQVTSNNGSDENETRPHVEMDAHRSVPITAGASVAAGPASTAGEVAVSDVPVSKTASSNPFTPTQSVTPTVVEDEE